MVGRAGLVGTHGQGLFWVVALGSEGSGSGTQAASNRVGKLVGADVGNVAASGLRRTALLEIIPSAMASVGSHSLVDYWRLSVMAGRLGGN